MYWPWPGVLTVAGVAKRRLPIQVLGLRGKLESGTMVKGCLGVTGRCQPSVATFEKVAMVRARAYRVPPSVFLTRTVRTITYSLRSNRIKTVPSSWHLAGKQVVHSERGRQTRGFSHGHICHRVAHGLASGVSRHKAPWLKGPTGCHG